MAQQNERPTVLVEDIDHTICNVAFDFLVLNVYGNSSLFGSLAKICCFVMMCSVVTIGVIRV